LRYVTKSNSDSDPHERTRLHKTDRMIRILEITIKGLMGYLSCDKRELVLAQVAEHAGAELFHTTAAVRLRGSAAHRARLHTQTASNIFYAALLAKLGCAQPTSNLFYAAFTRKTRAARKDRVSVFNFTQHHCKSSKIFTPYFSFSGNYRK
jgi:hypothetical protein